MGEETGLGVVSGEKTKKMICQGKGGKDWTGKKQYLCPSKDFEKKGTEHKKTLKAFRVPHLKGGAQAFRWS